MARATRWRVVAALATAGLVLAACGADDAAFDEASGDVEAGEDAGVGAPEVGGGAEEPAFDDEGGAGGDGVVTFGGVDAAGRQLARTARVTLEVDDVDAAARAVTATAVAAGGFVQGADVRGGDFGEGFLTLRVPAEVLDTVLEDVAAVGVRVVSSGISTEDLTDQLVDLQARIDNLRRLETELQELLTRVESSDADADQLLTVYQRITTTRGEIEVLEARRAAAADRVALATIEVSLVARAIAPEEVEPEPETTLGRAWATTVDLFRGIRDGLIWLVVTILPVLLAVVGVPVLLLWLRVRVVRRRRASRAAAALAAGPGPAPTGPPPPAPVPPAPPRGTAPDRGEPTDAVAPDASDPSGDTDATDAGGAADDPDVPDRDAAPRGTGQPSEPGDEPLFGDED